jgi:hypothetical protein
MFNFFLKPKNVGYVNWTVVGINITSGYSLSCADGSVSLLLKTPAFLIILPTTGIKICIGKGRYNFKRPATCHSLALYEWEPKNLWNRYKNLFKVHIQV